MPTRDEVSEIAEKFLLFLKQRQQKEEEGEDSRSVEMKDVLMIKLLLEGVDIKNFKDIQKGVEVNLRKYPRLREWTKEMIHNHQSYLFLLIAALRSGIPTALH